jgi:hypothetical protein
LKSFRGNERNVYSSRRTRESQFCLPRYTSGDHLSNNTDLWRHL